MQRQERHCTAAAGHLVETRKAGTEAVRLLHLLEERHCTAAVQGLGPAKCSTAPTSSSPRLHRQTGMRTPDCFAASVSCALALAS